MYNKYEKRKTLCAICRTFMPHYLAMATDGKLNQTMLLEIIGCLLVAGDGNVRSNKCLGYIY